MITTPPPPPNIIYIFPDQYRQSALGFWAQDSYRKANILPDPVYTPHLDSLAAQSLVLTSAVSTCPLSSPHRGMLMSGMYPDGNGVTLNCNSMRPISTLRQDISCIGDVLKSAGYMCAYFGKLHLDFPTPNDPQNPGCYVEDQRPVWDAYTPKERRHGFDHWYSYGTFDVHKQPHYWDTNGQRHEIREWSPKHEADQVIDYLTHRQESGSQTPFFIMLSLNPPHQPYGSLDDVEAEDFEYYKDKKQSELLIRPNADTTLAKSREAAYYFAAVTGVDRAIGRIFAKLRSAGLAENTIVVFTSDHGETMCSHGTPDPKNTIYSESFLVPFLIRYPGRIAPRMDNLMLSSPDIMPTLLGLVGLDKQIPSTVQGTNYAPLMVDPKSKMKRPKGALYLRNNDGSRNPQGQVISYFPTARGVRTDRYTLELTLDPKTKQLKRTLFFDDRRDPFQQTNLPFVASGEIEKELLLLLANLLKEANDPWYREGVLQSILPYQ